MEIMKNPWLEKSHIAKFEVWETVGVIDPYVCEPNTISFNIKEEVMLTITPEKFIVRGVEVEQGEGEAQKVYDAVWEFFMGKK